MAPGSEIPRTSFIDEKKHRIHQLQSKTETELQGLITQASIVRKQVTTAKTGTKKRYYEKKFKIINKQVLQMVGMMQHLEKLEKDDQAIINEPD